MGWEETGGCTEAAGCDETGACEEPGSCEETTGCEMSVPPEAALLTAEEEAIPWEPLSCPSNGSIKPLSSVEQMSPPTTRSS